MKSKDDKKEFINIYWEILKEMFPDCFEIDKQKDYLLLRVVSIYALNALANDIYTWSQNRHLEPNAKSSIHIFIYPLKNFDWGKANSPFSLLGGGKGVRKAHEIILKLLVDGGVEDAKILLENF